MRHIICIIMTMTPIDRAWNTSHRIALVLHPHQLKEAKLAPVIGRKKILILCDEAEMQIFFLNLLKLRGFQPVIFEGDSGLCQAVIDEDPDLIIIDVSRCDSHTLLYRNLKADQRLNRIPVIMLSTIDRRIWLHYLKCKCPVSGRSMPEPEAFLIKPPEARELLQLVHILTQTDEGVDDTQEWV